MSQTITEYIRFVDDVVEIEIKSCVSIVKIKLQYPTWPLWKNAKWFYFAKI